MYIHDVHILYYVLIAILGALIGIFINWCNIRLPENKKIFSKDIFNKAKRQKVNYIIVISIAMIYVILLYYFRIRTNTL